MNPSTLLIELLCEELPPLSLQHLAQQWAQSSFDGLRTAGFLSPTSRLKIYATPRRLAFSVSEVASCSPEKTMIRKGPAVAIAMKDDTPTQVLIGFAKSAGLPIESLHIIDDGKQACFAATLIIAGKNLSDCLQDLLNDAVKSLPIAKAMRWGSESTTFVRPVHGLVCLYDATVMPVQLFGVDSGNTTLGHRFLSHGPITITHAEHYENILTAAYVMVNPDLRRQTIAQSLDHTAKSLGACLLPNEALLTEVSALVEWPTVMQASFDEAFLTVPQECLILSMQQHQKYFPLVDATGRLRNHFLFVSNIQPSNPRYVIEGNERVLRARLSDAQFFFEQDQKMGLSSRMHRLHTVVYHHKIGSQAERVERLQLLSVSLAAQLNLSTDMAKRAAYLAKADLLSDMVGEFPELQGVMGRYYAQAEHEDPTICHAIENHYYPRFAGDRLPDEGAPISIATAIALADKAETLVGIWAIGLIPTGDKDPFALRRMALGLVRLLMQTPLSLNDVLHEAALLFPSGLVPDGTVDAVAHFCMERLKNWLAQSHDHDVIEAVCGTHLNTFQTLDAKLQAVNAFKALPEARSLAAANKRVGNLLKKNTVPTGQPQPSLFESPLEDTLYTAIKTQQPVIKAHLEQQAYAEALTALASLRPAIDAFFEGVMVLSDIESIKINRLQLLTLLSSSMNAVANISELTTDLAG
jgi:glycyl-tRNA synthetase beta chain